MVQRTQVGAYVDEELKRKAKENTQHGEISKHIRQVFRQLAAGEEPNINIEETQTIEERIEQLTNDPDYPDDWTARRKEVFRRDDYTCRNCGERGSMDGHRELFAHHIVPAERGGNHYLSNLVTLCKECHDAVHSPFAETE